MDKLPSQKAYMEAYGRMKQIKAFYVHLAIFIAIALLLSVSTDQVTAFFKTVCHSQDPNFLHWIRANIWVNLLIWFIIIIGQGVDVFNVKFEFIEKWETRKINEILSR